MLASMTLSVVIMLAAVALHYEGLLWLRRTAKAIGERHRLAVVLSFSGVIAMHLAEIIIFAVGYKALEAFGGGLAGAVEGGAFDYFYLSAQNYSTVGFGDVTPTGTLRALASLEPLTGLLLIAWSGAFLYGELSERHTRHLDGRGKLRAVSKKKYK
jgi:hypothetical protein